jgi:hypothetical protein
MIFKVGQRVYWNDPAEETSGVYVLTEIISDDIDNATIVRITNEYSEAEVFTHELLWLDEVYVCNNCAGFNLEHLVWTKLNDRKVIITDVYDEDKYFCVDCGETHHSTPTRYLDYEKNKKP